VILINNTVLFNFALARAVSLLREFCGSKGRATVQVLAEFEEGVQRGVLPPTTLDWLKRVRLRGPQERTLFVYLRRQLGVGEASSLAIAMVRGYDFLTDDMKARRVAQTEGVTVSGSVGVLLELIRMPKLTLEEGNHLLRAFILLGYFSSVERLDELLQ
jgi:predicted nucleic acid-binding protein